MKTKALDHDSLPSSSTCTTDKDESADLEVSAARLVTAVTVNLDRTAAALA